MAEEHSHFQGLLVCFPVKVHRMESLLFCRGTKLDGAGVAERGAYLAIQLSRSEEPTLLCCCLLSGYLRQGYEFGTS